MKKFLAMLLALTMVLSLAACGAKAPEATEAPTTAVEPTDAPTEAPAVETGYSVDYAANSVYAGAVTTVDGVAGGGEVGYDIYAGEAGKDYTDEEFYTYTTYVGGTTDMKWSTHNWETSDDSTIMSMITTPYYSFALNSTGDGWSVTCEAAAALPVDVTADYVGQYGIKEGDTLKAWKIALREDLTWENGEPIDAHDFVYSAKELLDPVQKNRRADSLYAGDFQIVGAKEYVYQGQTSYNVIGSSVADFVAAGGNEADLYVDMSFWGVTSADGTGYQLVTDDTMVRDPAVEDETAAEAYVSGKYLYETYLMDGAPYASYGAEYLCTKVAYEDNYAWENVGFIATGDYELVMITNAPIENPNYYVPYNLSSTYLVYEPMWEENKRFWDSNGNEVTADSDDIATVTNTYCTAAENTISYGPYKLSYFELDKQYTLDRNENWYGYHDGAHEGLYQTDRYTAQVIVEHSTAMMAFEAGEIMSVSLDATDMEKYGSSDYLMYTPQSYTTKLTFNTDLEALTNRGTGAQVLTNANLRKAFALSIDRATFCSSFTAGHLPGFALLNSMYVYDPFTGASYRDTDGAMQAVVELYGLTYGEDGEYGDLEEAYEAVTGYDPEQAKALMAVAYDECVAAGLYDGSSEVTLEIAVYSNDETYVKMFNFLNDALKAACEGTGFEGKLALTMKVDADYYNTMYSGNTDIIFSTWGGAAYSPYTMLYQCYCDAYDGSGNQMEYGFNTEKILVTINVNGTDVTDSLKNWADWAGGIQGIEIKANDGSFVMNSFGSYDADTRSNIFSKLEYAYLSFFSTTPIYYRNSVSVLSQKVNYPCDSYVDLVGYGSGFSGLEYITYNYTDAQWAEVASTLTY